MAGTARRIDRRGIHLGVGDVVIAPDGSRHTVRGVDYFPTFRVVIELDSMTLDLDWYDAQCATYTVERAS